MVVDRTLLVALAVLIGLPVAGPMRSGCRPNPNPTSPR